MCLHGLQFVAALAGIAALGMVAAVVTFNAASSDVEVRL